MVRPVTWAASPRRTTSTSGSSGTSGRGLGRVRGQRRVRVGRSLLLGVLLRPPDTGAPHLVADVGVGGEGLVVVGTLVARAVLDRAEVLRRRDLLQGYKYPKWLLIIGTLAWGLTIFIGFNAFSGITELWA